MSSSKENRNKKKYRGRILDGSQLVGGLCKLSLLSSMAIAAASRQLLWQLLSADQDGLGFSVRHLCYNWPKKGVFSWTYIRSSTRSSTDHLPRQRACCSCRAGKMRNACLRILYDLELLLPPRVIDEGDQRCLLIWRTHILTTTYFNRSIWSEAEKDRLRIVGKKLIFPAYNYSGVASHWTYYYPLYIYIAVHYASNKCWEERGEEGSF